MPSNPLAGAPQESHVKLRVVRNEGHIDDDTMHRIEHDLAREDVRLDI